MSRPPHLPGESDQEYMQRQLDPIHWAKLQALQVFTLIQEVIGIEDARRVFKMWSDPPSAAKLKWIKDGTVRDAVRLFGRTKGEIARERAIQKYGEPTPEQIDSEKRHLRRRLNKPRSRPKTRRGRTKVS